MMAYRGLLIMNYQNFTKSHYILQTFYINNINYIYFLPDYENSDHGNLFRSRVEFLREHKRTCELVQ
jgi:uncharacterized protein YccT (UPF0319 family)